MSLVFQDRNRVRNEFIGLKLLEVIKSERARTGRPRGPDSDLQVQLDVFDEQKESDEAQVDGPHGVDIDSHLDVFYSILKKVKTTCVTYSSLLNQAALVCHKQSIWSMLPLAVAIAAHCTKLLKLFTDN